MDPRLLEYYNQELRIMRESGAEFARAYPRVAARLGLDGTECNDPFVERLLESFAFLAARIQLEIDARHPQFTQQLLEAVHPVAMQPVPSCAIVEVFPDLAESSLVSGVRLPRGTALQTILAKGDRTACEFRTAQDLTLWPLTVVDARYLAGSAALTGAGLSADRGARAAIRIRLRSTPGVPIRSLPLDQLTFYIKSTPDIASRVHEQIHANCVGVTVRAPGGDGPATRLPVTAVQAVGFEDNEALLPGAARGFEGYRLLQEYFVFPERFLFFAINGLAPAVQTASGEELEIGLELDTINPALEQALDATHFRLHCVPVVNAFPRRVDRLHIKPGEVEHHVVPDRNRPMDFEVIAIENVQAVGQGGQILDDVKPLYLNMHGADDREGALFYTVHRRPRLLSSRQERTGQRSQYVGTETFISFTDSRLRRAGESLRQADIQALCSNRDLILYAPIGKGRTDFVMLDAAPVESVRCIAGPTAPGPSPVRGDSAWKVISHLSLNYLSLQNEEGVEGARLLREMLGLYTHATQTVARRQLAGLKSVSMQPVIRRLPGAGPIAYGRGLEITVELDDAAFEGTGILTLGAVLERFFARYVSINSFTQTKLVSSTRGLIRKWPVRSGNRKIL